MIRGIIFDDSKAIILSFTIMLYVIFNVILTLDATQIDVNSEVIINSKELLLSDYFSIAQFE